MKHYTERYMEQAERNLRHSCAEHVAEYESGTMAGEPYELLLWRKPGTGLYLMRYLSVGPRLVVTGDLREAIYCRAPGLRWWAGCGFSYFAEKCLASAAGRPPKEWDGDECLVRVKELIREEMREEGRRGLWRRFKEVDGEAAVCTEYDWNEFLREYGTEFFGQDWWELSFGRVISFDVAYHLVGLRLALETLDRQQERAA